jgi:hypothetical protein
VGGRPDAQLLANGDILVPLKDGGAWRISRVVPDQAEYADWLCAIQERERGPGLLERGVSFWVSAGLVLLAFWPAVIVIALVARAF